MLTRPGPFYIIEIAHALARKPGRVEVDREEADRITDDIAERYLRREFGDDEVVADHAGPPPARRSLAEIKEDARRRGEIWCLSQPEWRECYMLTTPAAHRYVESCGLAGAPRVLREWFGVEAAVPEARQSKTQQPRKERGKRGPKPEKRDAIADNMFNDLLAKRRTPEELQNDTLLALTAQYGGAMNTANAAREDALTRFSKSQKLNPETMLKNSEH